MKVQKYEIARVIDKLKSIVQKNDQFPALGGILVKDGYLIASNSEITMKVKLEASKGSYFIIPMKAFDLIKNLPDGEIDISATDKNVVMIKIMPLIVYCQKHTNTGRIFRNRCQNRTNGFSILKA